MNINEVIKNRHSVRQYFDKPLDKYVIDALQEEIAMCNNESGLNIQLVINEPKAFDSLRAHYGQFSGVKNYIALIGKKESDLEEKCGYYGERLVLLAQQLGLNSCWVAMTYKKIPNAFKLKKGEKLVIVIALGYGINQGKEHKIKTISDVSDWNESDMPQWYKAGVEVALLAPTAMNQQKFKFSFDGCYVTAKAGFGFYSKIDLGIVKYHFELGAAKHNFKWKR